MVSKSRLLAAAAALSLPMMMAAPAQAQFLDSMLNLFGMKPTEEAPEIEYRERAPLVVPPKMTLRPPEAAPSTKTAAWPNDPDVARRAAEAKAARTPRPNARESDIGAGKVARPSDLPGSRTNARGTAEGPAPVHPERSLAESGWVSPDKLQELGKSMGSEPSSSRTLVAGQEPPRRYLTDPPPGLRTPSDKGPLTAGKTLVRPGMTDAEERDPLRTFRPRQKDPDEE
ncbi:hypothetical protein [Alsobacter sp. R-9]